jgi:HAD superfamily hydrolase (TIGR01458 family)
MPRALLLDIDGVLVVSWKAVPGAVDALARIRDAGIGVRFLTNTTSRTRQGIAEGLAGAGFDVAPEEILTATAAVTSHLHRHHADARCLLLNSGDGAADLTGVDLVGPDSDPDEAGVVLVGGAGPEFSYDALNHAVAWLLAGAALVAVHRNVVWRTAEGLRLDAGPFVAALEQAAGVEATVVGKPSPAMFDAALDALGVTADDAAMVGDDLDSDTRGAQRHGITGVQVRTGKFRPEQLDRGEVPDVVLDSVADLPRWLGLT